MNTQQEERLGKLMRADAKQIAARSGMKMGRVPPSPRPESVGNDALELYSLIEKHPGHPTSFYAKLQSASLMTINKRITWLCSNHRRIDRSADTANPLYSVSKRTTPNPR